MVKRKMRATSIEAFVSILETLGERQNQVLKAIKILQPCSNLMISKYLRLPINSRTPRVKEIRDFGIARMKYIAICPETNRKVTYWFIPQWMNEVLL
jgi:hypothetical protein